MTILKGIIIGGTMLVPGVSGGSMAMLLGVYQRLLSAVSSFGKHKKENILFLATFSLGGGVGMLLFAGPLLELIGRHPMPTLYFFVGAVAGGVPMIYREAEIKRYSWKVPCYILAGFFSVLLFSIIPANGMVTGIGAGIKGYVFLLVAGFIAAVALVLPGISVSYLLLLMGLYDKLMQAIRSIDIPFLFPLGIGLFFGILTMTKFLEGAMTKHRQPTYLMILGFVLGSVLELFPGIPKSNEWLFCMVMLAAGAGAIQALSWKEKKWKN